jgi:hypothetical protein
LAGRVPQLLVKDGVQVGDERDVQTVQPHDWLAALVAMVVPGPDRGGQKIPLLHDRFFPADRAVAGLALDDEADGRRGVVMGAGDLAGQNELDAGIQGVGDSAQLGR